MNDSYFKQLNIVRPVNGKLKGIISDWFYDIKYYIPHSIRDCYYKGKCYFFPRQKWLTQKIPRVWQDKKNIIEICLFESLKHFVSKDGEDCFGVLLSGEKCHEPQRTFMREVQENYNIITIDLPELEKQLAEEWKNFENFQESFTKDIQSYEEKYGEIDKLEKEISDLKTKVMVWIVNNREELWT